MSRVPKPVKSVCWHAVQSNQLIPYMNAVKPKVSTTGRAKRNISECGI